jgi:hypothetical protein
MDMASGAETWGFLTGIGDADMARNKRFSKKTVMSGLFNED